MSQLRLGELGMTAPVHRADICDAGTCEGLGGPFDVVVCQDVLEHVLQPRVVVQALCRLLKPGGVVYVQIPNKYGVDQLMCDHHYGLTGLTALARPQAIEYWQAATGYAAEHYTVGYERGENYYRAAFAKGGVRLSHVQDCGSIHHLVWYAEAFSAMVDRLRGEIHPGLPSRLERRVRARMSLAVRLYNQGLQRAMALPEGSRTQAAVCDALVRRICMGLWRFIGVKEA
jgi:SAM-dependent methyltransferase